MELWVWIIKSMFGDGIDPKSFSNKLGPSKVIITVTQPKEYSFFVLTGEKGEIQKMRKRKNKFK